MSDETPVRCVATTAKGEPCKQFAVHGSDKCVAHLGRVGRKPLINDELVDKLVQLLNAGNYMSVACAAVGLARQTFRDWMERGRGERPSDEPYRRFREQIERALANGEARNVAQIASAARRNWQAAAWLLERQHPERWGRVSVRARDEPPPESEPETPDHDDPFKEVDELAERRRTRSSV